MQWYGNLERFCNIHSWGQQEMNSALRKAGTKPLGEIASLQWHTGRSSPMRGRHADLLGIPEGRLSRAIARWELSWNLSLPMKLGLLFCRLLGLMKSLSHRGGCRKCPCQTCWVQSGSWPLVWLTWACQSCAVLAVQHLTPWAWTWVLQRALYTYSCEGVVAPFTKLSHVSRKRKYNKTDWLLFSANWKYSEDSVPGKEENPLILL